MMTITPIVSFGKRPLIYIYIRPRKVLLKFLANASLETIISFWDDVYTKSLTRDRVRIKEYINFKKQGWSLFGTETREEFTQIYETHLIEIDTPEELKEALSKIHSHEKI